MIFMTDQLLQWAVMIVCVGGVIQLRCRSFRESKDIRLSDMGRRGLKIAHIFRRLKCMRPKMLLDFSSSTQGHQHKKWAGGHKLSTVLWRFDLIVI